MITHNESTPPDWALRLPKSNFQWSYDLVMAPLRMLLLPDRFAERLHLTSLRAERFAVVLRQMQGRCLDVGAGDNTLLRLYAKMANQIGVAPELAATSVGLDVFDWGSDCQIVETTASLPFADASFDSVSFVACLNHIPERALALQEARRVLRPGGRVIVTMIGRLIGTIGHAIWWYSEDKHREVNEHEEMGLSNKEMLVLLRQADFKPPQVKKFLYGLNHLYVAERD